MVGFWVVVVSIFLTTGGKYVGGGVALVVEGLGVVVVFLTVVVA